MPWLVPQFYHSYNISKSFHCTVSKHYMQFNSGQSIITIDTNFLKYNSILDYISDVIDSCIKEDLSCKCVQQPSLVFPQNLFTPFSVSAVTELTLGANQDLATARRLSWNLAGRSTNGGRTPFNCRHTYLAVLKAHLWPMKFS